MDESLISHFEELRTRLIRIVIVVLGLSCATFPFANQLLIRDDVTKSAEMAVNMITNNFLSGDESWMNH
jgi:Sec-independent protein secretion pathway component TatC